MGVQTLTQFDSCQGARERACSRQSACNRKYDTRMKLVGNYYYNSLLLFTMVKLYGIGSKAVVKNFLQDVIICVAYYIVGATLELLMR